MGRKASPTAFKPGEGGRKKGVKNKLSRDAVAAIWGAYEHLQGVPGKDMHAWAESNPDDFYKSVFSKIIPKDVKIDGDLNLRFSLASIKKLIEENETK